MWQSNCMTLSKKFLLKKVFFVVVHQFSFAKSYRHIGSNYFVRSRHYLGCQKLSTSNIHIKEIVGDVSDAEWFKFDYLSRLEIVIFLI